MKTKILIIRYYLVVGIFLVLATTTFAMMRAKHRFLPACSSFTDTHTTIGYLYTSGPGESQTSSGCSKSGTFHCYQHMYEKYLDGTTIYLGDLSQGTPPGDSLTSPAACQVPVAWTSQATCDINL